MADYLAMLEHSYSMTKDVMDVRTRLEFLGEYIFNLTTYDIEMSELFARKALEVCTAISDRATFDYIKDADNYRWYLLLCNVPFFADRLQWGTSIRGAWWGIHGDKVLTLGSCGLWEGDSQILKPMEFAREAWDDFIHAMVRFAADEGRLAV